MHRSGSQSVQGFGTALKHASLAENVWLLQSRGVYAEADFKTLGSSSPTFSNSRGIVVLASSDMRAALRLHRQQCYGSTFLIATVR